MANRVSKRPVRRRSSLRAALLCLCIAPASAGAAERPFGFVRGADTLPPTTLELESWFGAEKPRGGPAAWEWWLGPSAGLADHLEGSLFAVFAQPGGSAPSLALASLRLSVGWTPADRGDWPVDVRLIAEAALPVGPEHAAAWLWLIAARDLGPLHLAVNAVGWLEFENPVARYLDYLAGASWQLHPGVRLGGELHGSTEIGAETKLFAGPSLALARGRIWASSTFGLGLGGGSPAHHGRLIIGISL